MAANQLSAAESLEMVERALHEIAKDFAIPRFKVCYRQTTPSDPNKWTIGVDMENAPVNFRLMFPIHRVTARSAFIEVVHADCNGATIVCSYLLGMDVLQSA